MFPRVKLSAEKLLKEEVFRTLKPATIVECLCETVQKSYTVILQTSLVHVLIGETGFTLLDFIKRHSTQNQEILTLIKQEVLPFIYSHLITKDVP